MLDPDVHKPGKIYGVECKKLVRSTNYILFTRNFYNVQLYGIPIFFELGNYEVSFSCSNCLDLINLIYKDDIVYLTSNSKNSHFLINPGRRFCIHTGCTKEVCTKFISLDITSFNITSQVVETADTQGLIELDESEDPNLLFKEIGFKETYIATYPSYVQSQIVEQLEIDPEEENHIRFRCKVPHNEGGLNKIDEAILKSVYSQNIQGECIYTPYILYFDICGTKISLIVLFNTLSKLVGTDISEFKVELLVHKKEECGQFTLVDRS